MSTSPFGPLRASLFALLGLTACGGSTTSTSTLDPADAGEDAATTSDAGADAEPSDASPDDGDAEPTRCEDPQELLQRGGTPSGFVKCADGTIQRVEARPADPSNDTPSCVGDENTLYCESDADCTERPHGRCISVQVSIEGGIDQTRYCNCQYTCATDADCPTGQACIPGKIVDGIPIALCVPANCTTNADCASGECGLSVHHNGCGLTVSLGCREESDTCRTKADCFDADTVSCALSHEGGWQCQGETCAIGRPLLVDGQARTAAAESRADWSAHLPLPDTTSLTRALREELARHWLEIAAMEHASIASFARFSLQLLALGAPPDLLADAQRAALDEVEHARIAFAAASAYAGRALGPGALDVSDVAILTDRREVLRSLVFEACVNETLGTAEAFAIAARVSDPALVAIHRRIAEDERRHSELAWRTLAWLLDSADDALLDVAAAAFAEATAAMEATPFEPGAVAPEHGLLSAADRLSLRRQALREVVRPCASGLLDRLKMAA